MDKHALLNIFNHVRRLQVYMHDLIYVYPDTMPAEDYLHIKNIC